MFHQVLHNIGRNRGNAEPTVHFAKLVESLRNTRGLVIGMGCIVTRVRMVRRPLLRWTLVRVFIEIRIMVAVPTHHILTLACVVRRVKGDQWIERTATLVIHVCRDYIAIPRRQTIVIAEQVVVVPRLNEQIVQHDLSVQNNVWTPGPAWTTIGRTRDDDRSEAQPA